MSTLQVKLDERNSERADALTRQTGMTVDELVNEAFALYAANLEPKASNSDWKAALMQAAGMWKDRTDLPDFAEMRKSWNRDVWSR